MSQILLYGAYANCWVLRKREQANVTLSKSANAKANSPSYYPKTRETRAPTNHENNNSKIVKLNTNGESKSVYVCVDILRKTHTHTHKIERKKQKTNLPIEIVNASRGRAVQLDMYQNIYIAINNLNCLLVIDTQRQLPFKLINLSL